VFNISTALATLPATQHPTKVTEDKYMFLDTRRVVQDMADLGYEATGFRRARGRTIDANYGLHEVEFMKPEFRQINGHEAPRVLFMNSYDGTRKARFAAGIIRFACLNGMILGDLDANLTFLHMGNYEDELMAQMKVIAAKTPKVFDMIETFRQINFDDELYMEMAREALDIRYPDPETALLIDPATMLMPRRQADHARDLYTTFNVLQENVMRGGVPGINPAREVRLSQPVTNIERSNTINRELWKLLETTTEMT
jgi:hypothetical protein